MDDHPGAACPHRTPLSPHDGGGTCALGRGRPARTCDGLPVHVAFAADCAACPWRPGASAPPPEPPRSAVDYRQIKRDRDRVTSCPHRTPVGSCGCEGWCALGRGRPDPADPARGRVLLAECLECEACPPPSPSAR